MFSFRITRLIIIVFLITYFIGSFWFICVKYINTEQDVKMVTPSSASLSLMTFGLQMGCVGKMHARHL